jgi:hypothetical protein
LSGKIVYTSPGHGYNFLSGAWRTDRGDSNDIVEDFGNQDQFTLYVDYLFRAGATIVPMRPVGRQVNEFVLDNDSSGVTYSGSWSNSAGSRYYDEDYGAAADSVSYRFASISANETATATYTPNITNAGFYPVYTWVAHGSNRTSQLYKINHSGGQTQVRVDHRLVGNGWVYLGTYHFDLANDAAKGSVVISNQSTDGGSVVSADAIRFGNGMGDLPWGSGGIGTGLTSGKPREEEHSIVWLWRGIGQGVNRDTFFDVDSETNQPDSVFTAPAKMAREMNAGPYGTGVYIGFHSNAFPTPDPRGATGLYSTTSATPHQSSLATYTARQIETDMLALGYDWQLRTYASGGAFGELNNAYYSGEMDSTIIEVAFHTNPDDAAIMRDPKGRDQIGRSVYEATLEYFINWGTNPKPANVTLPSAPTNVRAVSNSNGQITLNWTAGPSSSGGYNGVNGSPATGFRVYASSDGYGFDGGTLVAGGGTTMATLTGLDPTLPYYFKVVAVNAGGESKVTEVITALPSGGAKQVLVVNGYDRFDESNNFLYSTALVIPGGGTNIIDRVWSRYNNSFDYVVQVHTAIHAAKPGVHVASTSNEAVINGAVNLTDYDAVIWILGEESTANETFNATEQTKVEQFIAGGGNLFLSGAEIGWDLDRPDGATAINPTAADRSFYENTLKGNYVSDDAGTYTTTPAAAGIFAGMNDIIFSNGSAFSSLDGQFYNAEFPDVIAPQVGAQVALNYVGGSGGGAAIQVTGTAGRGSIVMFGFPFETITNATRRLNIIDRVFDFFGLAAIVPDNADFNDDNIVDTADYVIWRKNENTNVLSGTMGDANHDGQVNDADYQIWRAQFGTSSGGAAALPAASTTITVQLENAPAKESSMSFPVSTLVAESSDGRASELPSASTQLPLVPARTDKQSDRPATQKLIVQTSRSVAQLLLIATHAAAAGDNATEPVGQPPLRSSDPCLITDAAFSDLGWPSHESFDPPRVAGWSGVGVGACLR